MIAVSKESYFDSLFLANKLDEYFSSFKLEEIHLFSYFSSLLYISRGNPPSTWEHRYTIKDDYPFCVGIQEALERHISVDNISRSGDLYDITGRGAHEITNFLHLSMFKERIDLLQAVCTSTVLLTYSTTIQSLLSSPDLVRSRVGSNRDWIHQDLSNDILLKILNDLGIENVDPLIPALTWLEHLSKRTEK